MSPQIQTEVLIVGAGPTGLSLACQLARYGVDFVIVEKKEGVTSFSKAIGVHARTLEIYAQLGLAEKAVAEGAIAGKVRFLAAGEIRGEADLSDIGQGLSPYPYVLVLEQSKNEQLLYEFLQNQGKDVLWQTELESFTQNETSVMAHVKHAGGGAQMIEAKYLVGCDGPKSPVRHGLGLTYEGSTFERMFYVADAQIDWTLSHDALHVCFAPNSFVLFFPLKGEKRYRIVGVFPEDFTKDEGDVLYEEIARQVKKETQLPLEISNVNWFSTYKVHTRRADKFSAGRCFLAGDAAHTHSPVGAQGMNTGIQDAYNLAWKLGLVLKENADERLLETYNEERLENAKRLLATTDRMFEIGAGEDWLTSLIRTTIFPPMAKHILGFDAVKKALFPLLSQIGISYRDSSLSRHGSDREFHVKAGDRMPYFQTAGGESIYDSLRQPKFHRLKFTAENSDAQAPSSALEGQYAHLVDDHTLFLDAQVAEIFGTDKPFQVLLRPDNYIGVLAPETSPQECPQWLSEILG